MRLIPDSPYRPDFYGLDNCTKPPAQPPVVLIFRTRPASIYMRFSTPGIILSAYSSDRGPEVQNSRYSSLQNRCSTVHKNDHQAHDQAHDLHRYYHP